MDNQEQIINRVAASTLVLFNLEEYYQPGERVLIDLKDQLHEGLILREKEFRQYVRSHNWQTYTGKHVAITCSADAIVPVWAFMLAAISASPYARTVVTGSLADLEIHLYRQAFDKLDWSRFKDARVVIKGCSGHDLPPAVYAEAAARMRSVARSIMYGEPCSTVPLFKDTTGTEKKL